uniref:Uncharacterized protein n=1 Tax=Panagrolaimus sp. JU765 TaxID=591449 RepID=A0AC34QB32_9BILA
MASKIFPVAYRMFNDTVKRGGVTFEDGTPYTWGDAELAKLNFQFSSLGVLPSAAVDTDNTTSICALCFARMRAKKNIQSACKPPKYQTKLIFMWFISTVVILYSMLCVVPQFCEVEEVSGEQRTWCMKKPMLGYLMAPILIFLIFICATILTWQWSTCDDDAALFHRLFRYSLKEEKYLSVIERELNCITDDDKESFDEEWLQSADNSVSPTENALPVRSCSMLIEASMLTKSWLNPLYIVFIAYHIFIVFLFGFFNEEKFKYPWEKSTDDDISTRGDIESGARLI